MIDGWLSVAWLTGTDINKVMVEEGYAWAFVQYSKDYAPAEETDKALKSGIWQADTHCMGLPRRQMAGCRTAVT